jgi:hypothetical protein
LLFIKFPSAPKCVHKKKVFHRFILQQKGGESVKFNLTITLTTDRCQLLKIRPPVIQNYHKKTYSYTNPLTSLNIFPLVPGINPYKPIFKPIYPPWILLNLYFIYLYHLHLSFHQWDIILHYFPNNFIVYDKVAVGKPISKTNNTLPWYITIPFLDFFRDLICCLTYDLEVLLPHPSSYHLL